MLVEMIGDATSRPIAFLVSLGVLGGAALITTVSVTRRGPMIYLSYAAIVLASLFYLRTEHVQGFALRFGITLGSFMIATIMLYLFIGQFRAKTLTRIPFLGHVWRLALMLAIGAILSAAVAQLSATRPR